MARRCLAAAVALAGAAALPLAAAAPARADIYRQRQQWVLNALDVPAAWRITQGRHVIVAVIDSGVVPTVSDLFGSVITGPDLTGVGTPPSNPNWGDHGTWMASLIAGHGHGKNHQDGILGVAPEAKILSIRVITDRTDPGFAKYQSQPSSRGQHELATAIRYAVTHGAGVISMSLGYDAPSLTVRSALEYALRHNVVVVASSGNSGTAQTAQGQGTAPYSFPADYPGVIGVAAVGQSGKPAHFSSDNLSVEVAAPGVLVPAEGRDNKYWLVSGTSPACALTAGVAALIRSRYPHLSAEQVRRAITGSSAHRPRHGYDDEIGFGIVDAAAALRLAGRLAKLPASQRAAANKAATGYFGNGPAGVSPLPVPPRGREKLLILSAIAALCLLLVAVSLWRFGGGLASRRAYADDASHLPPQPIGGAQVAHVNVLYSPGYPGQARQGHPGQAPGYPGQAPQGYPGQPPPGYPNPDQPGVGFPSRPSPGYPAQPPAGYRGQSGTAYAAQPGAGYPAQPGAGYPAQPGAGYPAQPGAGYPAQPGAGYPGVTDQPRPGYGWVPATSYPATASLPTPAGQPSPNQPMPFGSSGPGVLAPFGQPGLDQPVPFASPGTNGPVPFGHPPLNQPPPLASSGTNGPVPFRHPPVNQPASLSPNGLGAPVQPGLTPPALIPPAPNLAAPNPHAPNSPAPAGPTDPSSDQHGPVDLAKRPSAASPSALSPRRSAGPPGYLAATQSVDASPRENPPAPGAAASSSDLAALPDWTVRRETGTRQPSAGNGPGWSGREETARPAWPRPSASVRPASAPPAPVPPAPVPPAIPPAPVPPAPVPRAPAQGARAQDTQAWQAPTQAAPVRPVPLPSAMPPPVPPPTAQVQFPPPGVPVSPVSRQDAQPSAGLPPTASFPAVSPSSWPENDSQPRPTLGQEYRSWVISDRSRSGSMNATQPGAGYPEPAGQAGGPVQPAGQPGQAAGPSGSAADRPAAWQVWPEQTRDAWTSASRDDQASPPDGRDRRDDLT